VRFQTFLPDALLFRLPFGFPNVTPDVANPRDRRRGARRFPKKNGPESDFSQPACRRYTDMDVDARPASSPGRVERLY